MTGRGPDTEKTGTDRTTDMKRREQIKMSLNIGGQPLTVNVPFDRQEFARDTEEEIDSLYRSWRREFPKKSDKELLAMVAYQYASFYRDLTERQRLAAKLAEECIDLIDAPSRPEDSDGSPDEGFTLMSDDF